MGKDQNTDNTRAQIERLRERPTFIDQVNAALAAHQQGEPGIPGEPVVRAARAPVVVDS